MTGHALELGCLSCVRTFAADFIKTNKNLHFFVENAGLFPMGISEGSTSDGYEITYAASYLGHYLLLRELLPLIEVCGSYHPLHLGGGGWPPLM
eukprot:m.196024 g.196024  ORF g.196024 m.196024 type:complete len:94 (-) comp25047_c0_seq1:244-525(-)